MTKIVAIATFLFAIVLIIACYVGLGRNQALSCALGSSVMLFNLVGLWAFWKLVFLKKSIALAVLVIIFKYVILGLILWDLTQYQWLQPVGFIIGLSTLLFGVISSLFFKKFL